MHETPRIFREAVGVFKTAEEFQAAVDELLSSGFNRAELSLLASADALNEKLAGYANAEAAGDNPRIPRTSYISPEAIGDAQGGVIGALAYAGATVAAGAVVVSGGTLAAAVVAATLVGGTAGIVGTILAKWLGEHHAQYLASQIDQGGLLLWVQTKDAEAEERAVDIMKRHSSRDVHVHALPYQAVPALAEG
jgi:hypothetical protein